MGLTLAKARIQPIRSDERAREQGQEMVEDWIQDHEARAATGPYRRPWVPPGLPGLVQLLRRWKRPPPRLDRFRPEPCITVDEHLVRTARHPAIDFHTHLGRWLTRDGSWMAPDVGELIDLMDSCNVVSLVNLDGRWGAELEDNLDRYDRAHEGRFFTFCHLDWSLLGSGDGPTRLVGSLKRSASAGARGLKVWKDLGLKVTVGGRLLVPSDSRLDPVWDAAGELGLPVLIHVGDPLAYFRPVDDRNERIEELLRHPGTSLSRFGVEHYFSLLGSLESVVARHPGTTFVGAHLGCFPQDLGWLSAMLEHHANFCVDLGAQSAELGRIPRAAARLIEGHPDRVLFGTDAFPLRAEDFHVYFRLLETDDEYFAYSSDPVPRNGRWSISGLALSEATLGKVYRENACRLLGETPTGDGEHAPTAG